MTYQVLALKWRPQNFDELIGQEHVSRTLTNAIEGDRLAHSYILSGLRGTGKTTVARILAKCLNCEKGPTVQPCGECVACQEIADSRAMDVMEIDAASRTKVDQTRELLEMLSYSPVRDRYKILIIDEAHMLSKASFNALLKTLEEPPPNVIFVLATTELHKVLPTIVSRCQVFEFRRVSAAELALHLRKICDAGEIAISDASLDRLARAGEGSVRDSLSLLERALAFCGQQVEDADVLRMLGAVRAQVLNEMVAALARRDAAGMLTVLDGLIDEGHDLIHFWSEWITALRDLLLLKALPERQELLARSAEEAHALQEAADGLTREDLTRAFQIMADLENGLKSSAQPQFLFEAALIRLADLGAVRPIEELLKGLPAGQGLPAGPVATRTPIQKKKHVEPRPATRSQPKPVAGGSADAQGLIAAVRAARPMVGALLDAAASVHWSQDRVTVGFTSASAVLKKQLEQQDGLSLLRKAAAQLAGKAIDVRIESVDDNASAGAAATSTPQTADRAAPPAKKPQRQLSEQGALLDEARRSPGVAKLLDSFGAQVVEITPLEFPSDTLGDPES